MGKNTKIEWTTHTFNPWRGCTKVSPACAHCYAEGQAKRNPTMFGIWGDGGTRVVASEAKWKEPVDWNKEAEGASERPRVFCASIADVFEDWRGTMRTGVGETLYRVDLDRWPGSGGAITWEPNPLIKIGLDRRMLTMDDVRARLFDWIRATPNLDWLLLTKRPENMLRMVPDDWQKAWPSNVWAGTTVENQEYADKRIVDLLKVPARVRFLSCEPLLGVVDLTAVLRAGGIHWVIVGGESGGKARPMHPHWARALRQQCNNARVPFLFKQWGEWCPTNAWPDIETYDRVPAWEFDVDNVVWRVGKKAAGRMLDGETWDEVPTVESGKES